MIPQMQSHMICMYNQISISGKYLGFDRQKCPAVPCEKLADVVDQVKRHQVIGIDEGQFFPDIAHFAPLWASEGKTVVVAALDGTFQRKPFGNVLELVPMAEKVTKLSAVCMICCKKDAHFTRRRTTETKVEVIGGRDKYLAVCRACYQKDLTESDK